MEAFIDPDGLLRQGSRARLVDTCWWGLRKCRTHGSLCRTDCRPAWGTGQVARNQPVPFLQPQAVPSLSQPSPSPSWQRVTG